MKPVTLTITRTEEGRLHIDAGGANLTEVEHILLAMTTFVSREITVGRLKEMFSAPPRIIPGDARSIIKG